MNGFAIYLRYFLFLVVATLIISSWSNTPNTLADVGGGIGAGADVGAGAGAGAGAGIGADGGVGCGNAGVGGEGGGGIN